jgi:RHS repeat-associated protein
VIAEYADDGTLLKRYVHGPGVDEPLVEYQGTSFDDAWWLVQDRLGSVVARTHRWLGPPVLNRYDEYGVRANANVGTFQYTGQMWLAELGVHHYKARAYSPSLGRFLQPDPSATRRDEPVRVRRRGPGELGRSDGHECRLGNVLPRGDPPTPLEGFAVVGVRDMARELIEAFKDALDRGNDSVGERGAGAGSASRQDTPQSPLRNSPAYKGCPTASRAVVSNDSINRAAQAAELKLRQRGVNMGSGLPLDMAAARVSIGCPRDPSIA